ncbi:MAG TPA: helix-turn-helix domain-containing protein [Pseudonocardiaceae bacterium]|nr:helix-turn-helix domain-containing protein [Pseudonocardiaceae bacterium]
MAMTDAPNVVDAKILAAMTHPLRRRLLDVLRVDGPSTVSKLADRTSEAVGNVSHHVRVLAAANLVEQVPELSRDRRDRWWRLAAPRLRWSADDVAHDSAARAVATAAESLNLDRQVGLVRDWLGAPDQQRAKWAHGAFSTDSWLRLTPDELAELGAQLTTLLGQWAGRTSPDDGQDREPVFVFLRGVPGQP